MQSGTEVSCAPAQNSTSLIFPSKRPAAEETTSVVRVSEAEARLLFALALNRRSLPFAIEVPTTKRYSFKGTTPMSARIDLVAYSHSSSAPGNALIRNLAVEFKAHNPPQESIRKDLEKLIREGHDGLWFHILKNIDSGTLRSIFTKFRTALETLVSAPEHANRELIVAFVVRAKRLLFFRTVDVRADLGRVFDLDYFIHQSRVEVRDANGWHVEAL